MRVSSAAEAPAALMADPHAVFDTFPDLRARWPAGRVLLALTAVLTLVALLRPLLPQSATWLKGSYAFALAALVAGSGLLSLLRRCGLAAVALQAGLVLVVDALGQLVAPSGTPAWPLLVLLIGAQAVSDRLKVALALAGQATLLAVAEAAWQRPFEPRPVVAVALGYAALALVLHRAQLVQKRRLTTALGELAGLKLGIEQLEERPVAGNDSVPGPALALRQVTGQGRRARQVERASELDVALRCIVELARGSLRAHAVVYFDLDRTRERARVRVSSGPAALLPEAAVPLSADPFSFVIEREQPFYATDYKRLLWSLPWYRGGVRVGTLVAVPVQVAGSTIGVLAADRLETQAFTGVEPRLLAGFAALAGDAIHRVRDALGREELDAEFKAVYPISQRLSTLSSEPELMQLLLGSARHVSALDGAAVVTTDKHETRYVVAAGFGWPEAYRQRVVGLDERTWAAWALRSAEEAFLLGDLQGEATRMPVLVLDESARPGSLLAVPLRARNRTLAALVLTGPAHAFDSSSRRVLEILCNQAAATLLLIQDREQEHRLAVRDGLTGLFNRRAFNDLLQREIASEDRREKGSLGLVLLDIDHFKKLNDTHGHQAGDAALRALARLLDQHLRKSDQAARYGGEEFVVILPGTDEAHALQAAERLRAALHKLRFAYGGRRIPLSASFGVAVWPEHGKDAESLLSAADRSLYAAKEAGRNRVVSASTLVEEGQRKA